ncbi:MAG TPA: hypothetical protein VHV55_09110 [Pirellulales bacterium]|jgi:hypothetical protein|nr:hypothetical protein [Pirellulales bacterium]
MDACFRTYLALCNKYQLSPPWNCLETDPWAFRGPAEPSVILPLLGQHHPEQQLLAAGLAQRNGQGQLQLHRFLSIPDVLLVALRDRKGAVVNLMTLAGCVTGDARPLFGVFADQHTYQALAGRWRRLLLTSDMEDAILLRSVGLAAAPITGLDALNDQGLTLLSEIFGIQRAASDHEWEDTHDEGQAAALPDAPSGPGDLGHAAGPLPIRPTPSGPAGLAAAAQVPSHPYLIPGTGDLGKDADEHVPLTIVKWSPRLRSSTELEPVRRAVRYLDELHRFRGLELFEVEHWVRAEDEVEALEFALDRGEPGWVKEALLQSLDTSTGSITVPQRHALVSTAPCDFSTAVQQLHEALLGDSEGHISRATQRQALRAYHRLASQQIIEPMLRQAEAVSDPVERCLRLQLAQLNALFLEKMPTVRERLLRNGSQPAAGSPELGHDKSISELLAISSQLLNIAKEVKTWNRNTNPPPKRPPRTLTINSPRFANSDAVSKN